MSDSAFVDSNILIYAHDLGTGTKHDIARDLVTHLWNTGTGVLSTQVLQEFYVNVRRKAQRPLTAGEAARIVEDYLSWEVVVNSGEDILEALRLEERFRISFWDALIVQAASQSGAEILYSEDLNHGQLYGRVRVINPLL